jgi:hypothetical protein
LASWRRVFSVGILAYGVSWHRLNRKKWLRGAAIGVCSLLVLFSGFLAVYGSQDNARYDEDAVIILGAAVRGEEASLSLARRLDKAEEYTTGKIRKRC